jgi:hypothetical protein
MCVWVKMWIRIFCEREKGREGKREGGRRACNTCPGPQGTPIMPALKAVQVEITDIVARDKTRVVQQVHVGWRRWWRRSARRGGGGGGGRGGEKRLGGPGGREVENRKKKEEEEGRRPWSLGHTCSAVCCEL